MINIDSTKTDITIGCGSRLSGAKPFLGTHFGNKKLFSPNIFQKPTDICGWYNDLNKLNSYINPTRCTISQDSTTKSPVNGIPMKMVVTGTDSYTASLVSNAAQLNVAELNLNETITLSVYVMSEVIYNSCSMFIFGMDSSNNYINSISVDFNSTQEWKRYSLTYTKTNPSVQYIRFRLDGPHLLSSATVYWDGLQIEYGSNMTEFNPSYNPYNNMISKGIYGSADVNLSGDISHVYSENPSRLIIDSLSYCQLQNTNYPVSSTNPFSVEILIKIPSSFTWDTTYRSAILSRGVHAGYHGFCCDILNNNIQFVNRAESTLTVTTGIERDKWFHIIGTNSSTTLKIFNNGVLANSTSNTNTIGLIQEPWYVGRVGAVAGSSGTKVNCEVAMFNIYNYELTADDVVKRFVACRNTVGI